MSADAVLMGPGRVRHFDDDSDLPLAERPAKSRRHVEPRPPRLQLAAHVALVLLALPLVAAGFVVISHGLGELPEAQAYRDDVGAGDMFFGAAVIVTGGGLLAGTGTAMLGYVAWSRHGAARVVLAVASGAVVAVVAVSAFYAIWFEWSTL